MEGEKRRIKGKIMRQIYAVLIILLGLLILGMSVVILFHTKEIEVGGLEYASDTEVIEWVKQDEMSANTLYLLWKYRMQKPELLPFIDEVKVTLKSPWSVKINVTEKKIVGYIAAEEGYYYFDKEGLVVFQNEVPLEEVPCIEGMEVEEKKLYHQLKTADNKVFAHILDVTQLLKKEELKPDRILSDGKNVTLYFGAICVELGSGGYANKVVQLPAVLGKLEGQTGILQMKYYNADSKYISFRRTDPEAEAAKAEAEAAAAEAARQEAENQEEGAGDTQENAEEDGMTDDGMGDNIDSSDTSGEDYGSDSGSDSGEDSYEGEDY